jgi:hypothetical protein
MVGKTISLSVSTKSCSSSVPTSVPLPATRITPSVSDFSLAICPGTSLEITVVLCHSGSVRVVDELRDVALGRDHDLPAAHSN